MAERGQVVRFEQELASRIEDLGQQQLRVEQLRDMRMRWVRNAASIDALQAQLCLGKVEAYRARAETMRLRFAVDELQLVNTQEAFRIQQLLQATSPRQEAEAVDPTCTAEDVLAALQASMQSRQAQMEEYQDLLRESLAALLGDRQTREKMMEQLESAFVTQQSRLQEQFDTANSKLKQTTEEYLVLRHNTRVTQEMLAKSQQQSRQTCETMQQHLEQLKKSAHEQLLALQHSSQKDFEKVVGVHREQVVKMEHECAALERNNQRTLRDYKRKVSAIKTEMQQCQHQYDSLQMQRRHEIHTFNAELGALRKYVLQAEAVALDKATAREFGDMNIPPAHRKVWHEVAAPSLNAASRSAATATRKAKGQAQVASQASRSQYASSTSSAWARPRQSRRMRPSKNPTGRVSPNFRTNNAFRSRMAARQRLEQGRAEEASEGVRSSRPSVRAALHMSPIAEGHEEPSEDEFSQASPDSRTHETEFSDEEAEGQEEAVSLPEGTEESSEQFDRDDPNLGRVILEQPTNIPLQTYESVSREIQSIREKMDWLLRQSESQGFQR